LAKQFLLNYEKYCLQTLFNKKEVKGFLLVFSVQGHPVGVPLSISTSLKNQGLAFSF
jgi:hypothetical protein